MRLVPASEEFVRPVLAAFRLERDRALSQIVQRCQPDPQLRQLVRINPRGGGFARHPIRLHRLNLTRYGRHVEQMRRKGLGLVALECLGPIRGAAGCSGDPITNYSHRETKDRWRLAAASYPMQVTRCGSSANPVAEPEKLSSLRLVKLEIPCADDPTEP